MSTDAITNEAQPDSSELDALLAEHLIPEEVENRIERALDAKDISPRGEKLSNLNDEGRRALDSSGATLKTAATTLSELLHSDDEKTKLNAAKFIFERHSGKLDGNKENSDHGIVINIGNQQINNNQGSIFNPDPVRTQVA